MSWFIHSLKNYANFSGRANRREWWIFWFFFVVPTAIVTFALPNMADGSTEAIREFAGKAAIPLLGAALLWNLVLIIPYFAVTVRRLHDIGLSGWWLLLVFVPIIGAIFFLIVLLWGGNRGENAYGNQPPVHPSIPMKPPESFGATLSREVEHEEKTEELIAKLHSIVESHESPESLDLGQKDLLIRFYGHWFPKHRVDTRLKEYRERYAVFLGIPAGISMLTLSIDWLLGLLFGWHPLGDSGAGILWSLILTVAFLVAIMSADLTSAPDVRIFKKIFAFLARRVRVKLERSYSEHKSSGTASEFFVTEIYPALSKALKKPKRGRKSGDAEKNRAKQQCIKLAAADVVTELSPHSDLSRI